MAKQSQINRNKKREKLVAQYAAKRAALKAQADDMKVPAEERFAARLKLAKLPRNSSKVRIHHRCELSGRPKGYYRKLKLSRIALRSLSNFGQIPGMTKASWSGAIMITDPIGDLLSRLRNGQMRRSSTVRSPNSRL